MSGATAKRDDITTLKRRAVDLDRHIGMRLRNRRLALSLTQQQLASLLGVTYQQAHKYEKGINRIAAGRLFAMAQALGVTIGYFYQGIGKEGRGMAEDISRQRLLVELTSNFAAIVDRRQQEAIGNLARVLAGAEQDEAVDEDRAG